MTDIALPASTQLRPRLSVLKTGLYSAIPGLLLIAIIRPRSPDLIAQLARATMAEATAGATWWTSWYGGISTPSYSAISPELMRLLGVWTVGIASAVITIYCAARILESRTNARLAVVLVSLAVTANLASGRITFAIGTAFAAMSLMFYLRNRTTLSAVAAGAACLGSPLAGMFLVMAFISTATERTRRNTALFLCAATMVPGAIIALAFPLPGSMPMRWVDVLLGATACIVMWLCKPNATILRLTALLAFGILALWAVETPVGINILRLPMLFMAPVVAIVSTLSARKTYAVIGACLVWMTATTVVDLVGGNNRSFEKSYYAPLLAQLPSVPTNRVEVVDPATHGPAFHVAQNIPIARGWERQVDVTRNSIFYDGTLNPNTYRNWLDSLAVKWVALPNAPLDYASKKEGELVRAGLPYLTPTWHNADWTLYEVSNATPMATGVASIDRISLDTITLSATGAGEGNIKVAWIRGLTLINTDPSQPNGTITRDGTQIRYSVPAAGTYTLSNERV